MTKAWTTKIASVFALAIAGYPLQAQPDSTTESTVTIAGQALAYTAVAGTIPVGSTDSYDTALGVDGQPPDSSLKPEDAPATARMFYAAYFKKDAGQSPRPVMFFYNGGPGQSTMWLH